MGPDRNNVSRIYNWEDLAPLTEVSLGDVPDDWKRANDGFSTSSSTIANIINDVYTSTATGTWNYPGWGTSTTNIYPNQPLIVDEEDMLENIRLDSSGWTIYPTGTYPYELTFGYGGSGAAKKEKEDKIDTTEVERFIDSIPVDGKE